MPHAAVLLAAGESPRMGGLKALPDWRGQPLLLYQLDQLSSAGLDPIIVVLGHRAEALLPYVERSGARAVENPIYQEGRASSVRAGARALPPDCDGVLVLSVDQPRP